MSTAEALNVRGTGFRQLDILAAGSPPPHRSLSQPDVYREFRWMLSRFDPISLAEMDEVALLDRTDTKYVMSARQLHSALASLPEHYRVLDIDDIRLNRYRTVYFDTEDFTLYRDHHSGKRARCKVRSREYVETGLSFLEVKWKAKRDRTVKERIRTSHFVTEWPVAVKEMEGSRVRIEVKHMEPTVSNEFYRITLVGKRLRERVTLDLEMRFHGDGRTADLPGVTIAEVKQDGVNRSSDFVRQMRAAGIRPSGFSKYCMGLAMLYQEVKHNRFKPSLRMVGKLMGGDYDA